jgi:hypothetical protein
MDKQKKYLEFASTLSFFQFLQKEFYNPHFNVNNYHEEINLLQNTIPLTVEKLSKILQTNPKLFDIFEQIFQLYRFTNTQLINFLFDVNILNDTNERKIITYLYQNLNEDESFRNIFNKYSEKAGFQYLKDNNLTNINNNLLIKLFKESIVAYVDVSSKKRQYMYSRIKNNENVRRIITNYLIDNLKINEMLESINLKEYLKNKRIPKDTKTIHGKFGTIKIKEILIELGIENIDLHITTKDLSNDLYNAQELKEYQGKWVFVTEKYLKNILRRKQRTPKKFDFIILYNLVPKYVIETNFYSTSGSKIGINEEEYIDLNEEINEKSKELTFFWITDGNYWLTSDGESRYTRDLDYFNENILNYNQFKTRMQKTIQK